ncbi:nucleic acid binding phosphoprotein [Brazilian porcupinepox virus 1]|nr:nucleic acid binding phosphoprotein [Brazilian porcupinepox virus 1]
MTHNTHTPFYIDTKEGKYLVLKAIKVCDIRSVECNAASASCVLKVDPPPSPSCNRPPSPCERARSNSPNRRNDGVAFMRTNMLEDIKNNNRNIVSRIFS